MSQLPFEIPIAAPRPVSLFSSLSLLVVGHQVGCELGGGKIEILLIMLVLYWYRRRHRQGRLRLGSACGRRRSDYPNWRMNQTDEVSLLLHKRKDGKGPFMHEARKALWILEIQFQFVFIQKARKTNPQCNNGN